LRSPSSTIPAVRETQNVSPSMLGNTDGAFIAALQGYPATTVGAPGPFHDKTDIFANLVPGAVEAVTAWAFQAVEERAAFVQEVEKPRPTDPSDTIDSVPQTDYTNTLRTKLQEAGMDLESDLPWPVSQGSVDRLGKWLDFMRERWPAFLDRIKHFQLS